MQRRPRLWLTAALAALATGAIVVSAALATAPGATVDQSNASGAPAACGADAWAPDTASDWIAQTFTAGVTGTLTDVGIPIFGTNTNFVLAIAPVDASGAPVIGSPLASQAVSWTPPTSLPLPVFDVLFATPTWVVAGTRYAIVLSAPNENTSGRGPFIAWQADLGSSQSFGGTACPDGKYAGGRAWASNAGDFGADADFFFQTFVVAAKHLAVQAAGSGSGTISDSTHAIDCGAKCSADLAPGAKVTLTAKASAGSVFSGWSGDGCAGTSPTCSLTLVADANVTATFTAKATLVVHDKGAGKVTSHPAGINCGSTCKHVFQPGKIDLMAKPAAGWMFMRWLGACHGTKTTCHLALDGGTTAAIAVFAKAPKKK